MADQGRTIEDVVSFWRDAGPDRWFTKDDAFDELCRTRLRVVHFEAARREHDDWVDTPEGALALMVLLDQYPRNAFRGTAHMYATDPLARHFARTALERGHDRAIEPALRLFLYLPFEHSEDLADQDLCVALHRPLDPELMRYALDHQAIIRRFGRFPHRNALLMRATTPDEQRFLDEGGFAG